MGRWTGRNGGTSGTMEIAIVGDGFFGRINQGWCVGVLYLLCSGRYCL